MSYDVINMKSIAKDLNNLTYTDYFYRLMLIARSVFKWNNLPKGIDEKWIERYLFTEGSCVFFDDKDKGFMVAKCTESGDLNPYDEPTRVTPYGTGYMGAALENNKQCVIISNNDLRLPTSPTIQLYALRLSEIARAIDVNVAVQKTPFVILTSEKKRLSFQRAMQKVGDNEIFVYGTDDLDLNSINVLKTDAPVVFDKLEIQKHTLWNECMTFLGIQNANQDKRERQITDEVKANNEQICISADVMLKSRQRACELINSIFGLNVSVELREDLKVSLEQFEGGVKDVI